jgi:hypothetical protein
LNKEVELTEEEKEKEKITKKKRTKQRWDRKKKGKRGRMKGMIDWCGFHWYYFEIMLRRTNKKTQKKQLLMKIKKQQMSK